MTKSLLKNYRQSPRKVRLVADAVRGKKIDDALITLRFMPKRAADPVKKVIESAIANAKNNSISIDNFVVREISIDDGVTLKRWRAKWRGTAHPIRKRTSHIKVVLGPKDGILNYIEKKVEVNPEEKVKAESNTEDKKAAVKKKVAKKSSNTSSKQVTKSNK